MPKITPFLWFDHEAEAAANHYVSIFPNSRIKSVSRYGEGGPGPAGTAMTVEFQLDGQDYIALNGGPLYKFTEAISFSIECQNQVEVDHYWNALTAGGEESRCGWLKDKFGLSWQVVPVQLGKALGNPDPALAGKAMMAMMKMNKIVIADLS